MKDEELLQSGIQLSLLRAQALGLAALASLLPRDERQQLVDAQRDLHSWANRLVFRIEEATTEEDA